MTDGRELGWDEQIESPNEGDFAIFPNGVYPFVVTGHEKGRFEGSEKLPACNQVIANIEFDGGPLLDTTTVRHRLYLHTNMTGLLSQFFRGVNLRKHGDPLVLKWDAVAGRRGWAELGTREHKGKTYQSIKKFLDQEDWPTQVGQPAVPVQQQQFQPPAQPAPPVGDAPF